MYEFLFLYEFSNFNQNLIFVIFSFVIFRTAELAPMLNPFLNQ